MDKPIEQTQLRILLLEDVPTDAELMEDALREAGLSFIAKRVDTREAFIHALDEFKPDIVLADYKLPGFDGGTALKIVRQQYPTIPVVMVTGAVGDEKAVELLKQGARDYVIKDRLGRLGSAVQMALEEEKSIRARKAAEQALRQSEEDFRALVEQSPIAMLVDAGVGADAKTVMMNRKFTELFGYTPADVPDEQHWWPLAYPDEAYREEIKTEWTQRAEEAFRNRSSIEPMEASITCKDGAIRYIRISFTSIGDKNILGFEDLTKRKQAEDELERFFNLIPDPVCIASADGHFLKINPAWQELLGYTTQEILAKPFLDLIHPDDRAATIKEVERQLAGKATVQFPNRYLCKDGSYKWLEWKATPAVDGKLLFASARDITERISAENKLRESEERYRSLFENMLEGYAYCRMLFEHGKPLDFIYLGVNDAFGKITGLKDVVGKKFSEVIPGIRALNPELLEIYGRFALTGHPEKFETYVDELKIWFSVTVYSPRKEHFVAVFDDITDRKKADARLAESEQHFRAVTESANDAIITISGSDDIVDWNLAAERLFGRTKAEMTALPITALMPERFRDLHSAGIARVASGGTPHVIGKAVELVGLRKDGSEFPLELSLAQWHSGQSQFFTAIIRDIAERKTLEGQLTTQYQQLKDAHEQLLESSKQLKATQSQLMQSAKMASIGLLAAGVAHEINNPIGYVNSNMGTLEKYLADIFAVIDKFEDAEMVMGMLMDANDPLLEELRQFKKKINLDYIRKDIKALITESHQGLERVKRIVLDLKNFSHADSDDQWLWADIHQVLDATLSVVWNELKYKCEVVKEYGVLPKIYCLPAQLDQVFMNLLVNAAQAIEVRGKITIRTGQEGDRVWVEVSDTGKGIPPEDFPNLLSGSSDTSLRRRPLRTVHAPHNAYGSSRSKASCDTRFHNCIFQQTLMIPTAIEMVHFKIACRIRPAVSSFHNMTNIPWNAFCDRLLTG